MDKLRDRPPVFTFRVDTNRGRSSATVEATDNITAMQVLLSVMARMNLTAPQPVIVTSIEARKQGSLDLFVWLRRLPGDGYQPIDPAAIHEMATAFGALPLSFVGSVNAGEPVWKLFGLEREFQRAKILSDVDLVVEEAALKARKDT